MDLSIVIVNWNTREMLACCLESVFKNVCMIEQLNTETFVVDNTSADGSAQMVRQRFPWVKLIENVENVGFAQANNQAVRQSLGRYVLLLNPDTKVLPGALQTLIDFIQKHPEAGVVGPMILNPDSTLQSSCNPMPTLWREFWRLMYLDSFLPQSIYREESWDLTVAHKVEVIQGNCMLIHREVMLDIGLLDERFFMFTEEVDLCYRLLQKGWSIYWLPTARIIHYGGQSTRQAAREMFMELYRSKLLFFRKTQGRWGGLIYKFILLLATLTRIPSGLINSKQQPHVDQRSSLYLELLRVLPSL